MIPWAKGFIASQVLNAKLVGPAWGLNRRRYWKNFNTSRLDVIAEQLLRTLPRESFNEAEYYGTGVVDFGEAIQAWAVKRRILGRRNLIVAVDGMYGGYRAIASARSFLWSRFLNSKSALENMYRVLSNVSRQKLLVAVHMRLGGDFAAAQSARDVRTQFNIQVPISWYREICAALRSHFQDSIQFLFFTDKETPEFLRLISDFSPHQIRCRHLSECSDLLIMANADLRVCSVSSYSLAACFLSGGPYLWYEPQLNLRDGIYSLWGHEPRQQQQGSPTKLSTNFIAQHDSPPEIIPRGYPIRPDGAIPASLLKRLNQTLTDKDCRTDLLQYGCLPAKVSFAN